MPATVEAPTKTDDDKPFKLFPGQSYGGWKIVKKLDEGGFGQVYIVKRREMLAALKAESNEIEGGSAVKLEVSILMFLNRNGKRPHVPHLYHAAKRKKFCYMIVTLLGENIRTLRLNCQDEKVKPETWARLGIQCLYSIKLLHDVGFVHRDIKPANFVMGHENDADRARLVHILDFGLARSYAFRRNGAWVARRARKAVDFRGTMRYCSPDMHLESEQGRKDDIWSLVYMLIELHCSLPWQKEKDREKLVSKKLNTPDSVLLMKFPVECHPIVEHLRELNCYNRPDYSLIQQCFLKLIKRLNVDFSAPYDWEDPKLVETINKARTKRPDYEAADEFFTSDPLKINDAPPKTGTNTTDEACQATVEDNKEIIKMAQMDKVRTPSSQTKGGTA